MINNLSLFFLKLKIIIFKQSIYFLSFFINNNNGYWIISLLDGGGSSIAENCLSFANYLKKKKIKFKCISKTKVKGLEDYTIKPLTLKYFYFMLNSKVLIIESDLHNDLPAYRSYKTFKVNLFHGMAVKKIYHSSKHIKTLFERNFSNNIRKILKGFCYTNEYDLISVTNNFFKKTYIDSFLNKNVRILGQPRNDNLNLKEKENKNSYVKKKILKKLKFKNKKKILLYLPTFRDKSKVTTDESFLNNLELINYLKKKNCIILYKDHIFNNNFKILKKIKIHENIYKLNNDFLTSDLIKIADCLITDYSSIYIDFLLMEKPIIFYCYDIERYKKNDRELNFDYNNDVFTPGKKIYNQKNLVNYLYKITKKNKFTDTYKKKRSISKKFFFNLKNKNSSEEIFKYIYKKINLEKDI